MKLTHLTVVTLLAASCSSQEGKPFDEKELVGAQNSVTSQGPESSQEKTTSLTPSDAETPDKTPAGQGIAKEKTGQFRTPEVKREKSPPPIDADSLDVSTRRRNGWVEGRNYVHDELAKFPGGIKAMEKFISDNMRYPEKALKQGMEGRCNLRFTVAKDGTISNIIVQQGVPDCPECDKEAIRIVKRMPKWTPATIYRKAVKSKHSVIVSFKLS